RINPAGGIATAWLNQSGNYVVSYNQDFATGTVKVYGDYAVSGSTLTLDYASQVYASTATAPQLMYHTGGVHTSSVTTTYDANALTQLITITYLTSDSKWHVTGSSSPGDICTISGASGGTTDCPNNSSKQFNLTVNGSSPQDGDFLNFALIAASGDSNYQKKL